MYRLLAIFRKEFIHIMRDPRSLMIMFIMPVMMLLIFGYAVKLDLQNIPLMVWDQDQTTESRELVDSFIATSYFSGAGYSLEPVEPDRIFRNRSAKAVLTIPEGFGRALKRGEFKPVQFISDASDSNTAVIAGQYAEQIMLVFAMDKMPIDTAFPDIRLLILFNPELESTVFIVPGLVAVLFMMVCALMTSITIAREKETGTMEQILVSPVNIAEIILGKVLPYVVLSSVIAAFVIVISMLIFHVPFHGNPLQLAAGALIYLFCSLAYGILISTKAKTMQVAMMVALVSTILPSVMLSGFIFPIASMPEIIRWITRIVPARYFLVIIRGIMLKGTNLVTLQAEIYALTVFLIVLLAVSIKNFKTRLES